LNLNNIMTKQSIFLITNDSVKLAADYYQSQGDRAVILLHQMRTDKTSYDFLIPKLLQNGYQILALDLRGHGQSQGELSKFTDKDFQNMFSDAWAAETYLHELNPQMKIQMIGASIGANTALRFQEMNTVDSVVALSPGLNYHGIDPTDANLGNIACPILYINTEGDNSAEDTRKLFNLSPLKNEKNQLKIYSGDKHGVYILQDNPKALEDVINWLNTH